MPAPRIQPLHAALSSHAGGIASSVNDDFLGEGEVAFLVVHAGLFRGTWFERGQLIVCAPGARPGQAVVLVAHSHGRPRLGVRVGLGFLGDHEEPCSSERWMAAGHIRAVYQRGDVDDQPEGGPAGWRELQVSLDSAGVSVSLTEVGASWRTERWPTRRGASRPPHSGAQLALFAA